MKFYVLLITSTFLYLCYIDCIIFENQYVRFVPLDGTANRKVLFEIALLSGREVQKAFTRLFQILKLPLAFLLLL